MHNPDTQELIRNLKKALRDIDDPAAVERIRGILSSFTSQEVAAINWRDNATAARYIGYFMAVGDEYYLFLGADQRQDRDAAIRALKLEDRSLKRFNTEAIEAYKPALLLDVPPAWNVDTSSPYSEDDEQALAGWVD